MLLYVLHKVFTFLLSKWKKINITIASNEASDEKHEKSGINNAKTHVKSGAFTRQTYGATVAPAPLEFQEVKRAFQVFREQADSGTSAIERNSFQEYSCWRKL